jgi:hypothetical protein
VRRQQEVPPEQTPQLTEQARNCDHHSSDPSSQAKKQQKITQQHSHVSRLPHFPCAVVTLTFQEIAFVLVPDTWAYKHCSETTLTSQRRARELYPDEIDESHTNHRKLDS